MGSYQAKLYHSIIFHPVDDVDEMNDINTWDDWHLVPTSRPKFNMPSIKTQYVDIPGSDGMLDLTAALTGRAHYGNRQGSIEFLVMNDYGDWATRYSNIATYLHGRSFTATLEDDPMFYYEGRFSVNEWKSEAQWSRIVIDYNVGPFKKSSLSINERWLWDPFRFEGTSTGKGDIIYNYKDIVVKDSASQSIDYIADLYESSPTFVCKRVNSNTNISLTLIHSKYIPTTDSTRVSGKTYYKRTGVFPTYVYTEYAGALDIDVTYYEKISKTYELSSTYSVYRFRFSDMILSEGINTFDFTGNGIVTIESTGGRL